MRVSSPELNFIENARGYPRAKVSFRIPLYTSKNRLPSRAKVEMQLSDRRDATKQLLSCISPIA